MAKRTLPTNPSLLAAIEHIKPLAYAKKSKFWERILADLMQPTRKRREVNVGRISEHHDKKHDVVVPGKVLSGGTIDHAVTVYAWRYSAGAKEKILGAKGKALSIADLIKNNPHGKNVQIIG